MRLFLVLLLSLELLSCLFSHAQAQESTQQSGIIDENNKNSSSFVADPDPLDPLPVKKENIKEGDEIILDDIRQVIDRPAVKASSKTNKIKKTSKASKASQKNKRHRSGLKSDSPDERLETQLHRNYLKYDINPTSVDQWGKAIQGQKENIYVVQKHDTLFTISRTLFGDSKFWPKIWALNRSSILNPHQIAPGMKIYFYAGDENNLPSLSFNSSSSDKKDKEEKEDNDENNQNTEFNSTKRLKYKGPRNLNYPVPLPDSLPITYNRRLSMGTPTTQMDLRNLQYIEVSKYENPYFLSSTELKSDFIVPDDQIPYLLCKDNQFVPLVTKKNSNAVAEKYLLVAPLAKNPKGLRSTYKYKIIGSVNVNAANQMRVSNCKQLMDIETLIVSQEKITALSEPQENFSFTPSILDSLEDFKEQQFYTDNQYLVININGLNVDNGAELNIYSDALGKNVGRVRILQRSGTVAIAVITHTYDLITKGDKVLE